MLIAGLLRRNMEVFENILHMILEILGSTIVELALGRVSRQDLI